VEIAKTGRGEDRQDNFDGNENRFRTDEYCNSVMSAVANYEPVNPTRPLVAISSVASLRTISYPNTGAPWKISRNLLNTRRISVGSLSSMSDIFSLNSAEF
jgi:hypothetical protein